MARGKGGKQDIFTKRSSRQKLINQPGGDKCPRATFERRRHPEKPTIHKDEGFSGPADAYQPLVSLDSFMYGPWGLSIMHGEMIISRNLGGGMKGVGIFSNATGLRSGDAEEQVVKHPKQVLDPTTLHIGQLVILTGSTWRSLAIVTAPFNPETGSFGLYNVRLRFQETGYATSYALAPYSDGSWSTANYVIDTGLSIDPEDAARLVFGADVEIPQVDIYTI